jgi:probable phosphoglycerate mutase
MKPTQLCIARHGETDWNKSGVLQGWFDIPINDLGRTQARGLATKLANAKFDAIWASPLARAYETAQIVAAALQLPDPTCHDGLKEKHFGAIQGIPKSELAELNPAMLEQILRRNPAAEFVGGESLDEFVDRVLEALNDIGARHAGERVLVVTHGWVMDVVTRHINGHSRSTVLHQKPQNGECLWVELAQQQLRALEPAPHSLHY